MGRGTVGGAEIAHGTQLQAWQHRIIILFMMHRWQRGRYRHRGHSYDLIFKLRNRFKLRQQPKKSTITAAVQEFWSRHNNKRPPRLNAPSKDFDLK